MQASPRIQPLLLWVTYAGFLLFGLSEALLGVAWPSIRSQMGLPNSVLGMVISASMIGLMTGSLLSGWMTRAWGSGATIALGAVARGLAMLSFPAAGGLPWLVAASFSAGFGGGVLASGSNALVAQRFKPSQVSWLHASFGIGATIGPLLVTSLLESHSPWQTAYLLAGGLELAVAGVFTWVLVRAWGTLSALPAQLDRLALAKPSESLLLPFAWLGILLFFFYRGIEVAAGQWTYTLFTENRAATVMVAGISVSLYWGGMTAGRILFGFVGMKMSLAKLLRGSTLGTILGLVLLSLNLSQSASLAALLIVGFSMASIFPMLTADTPRRVGWAHTANVVGFQIAGGSLGGSLIPSLAGYFARSSGLEVLGPLLIAVAVLFGVLLEAMLYLDKGGQVPAAQPSARVHSR